VPISSFPFPHYYPDTGTGSEYLKPYLCWSLRSTHFRQASQRLTPLHILPPASESHLQLFLSYAPPGKRANFQELAAEDLMTKEELRSKVDAWELAREAAEHELRPASERSERLSALEGDAEHLLAAYEERCVEALADLSPEERREVYKLLDLTVEAHPALVDSLNLA
jgi:hypothetical protein